MAIGLGTRINKIGERPEFAAKLSGMEGLFATVRALVHEVETGRGTPLLAHAACRRRSACSRNQVARASCPGLSIPMNGETASKGVSLCRACWERKGREISADPGSERDFRALLNGRFSGQPCRHRASGSCRPFVSRIMCSCGPSRPGWSNSSFRRADQPTIGGGYRHSGKGRLSQPLPISMLKK